MKVFSSEEDSFLIILPLGKLFGSERDDLPNVNKFHSIITEFTPFSPIKREYLRKMRLRGLHY